MKKYYTETLTELLIQASIYYHLFNTLDAWLMGN